MTASPGPPGPGHAGLQPLSREDCVTLLASAPIGRVVFTDQALPAVQPVAFAVDGDHIVIRAAGGSRLAGAIVAFQVDAFDPVTRTGWSVTALGRARAVRDAAEADRLSRLPMTVWAHDAEDHYVVIPAERLTGRRVHPGLPRQDG
ncbi:pyridoxamine 5'-phosphate oxidase [Microtetraspora sp. NBRC 13810]|uniref:pyridoxamine 5'-phosphate oxidase family protein n=1 Tax=Microtetraspora sp. NBRC 13810 TaxID=3030990 RepID=UPI0024A3AA88|nr:pyridoxamine 5'-phosphate oxidase family protein [Microtetraspora sp. NBRC 13810]GLW07008.1 pyridoxamine 5'-phosphate oxidase [Microtetraspora sp. NBRC 13810]